MIIGRQINGFSGQLRAFAHNSTYTERKMTTSTQTLQFKNRKVEFKPSGNNVYTPV